MERERILDLFSDCDFEGVITQNNFEDKIIAKLSCPDDFSFSYFSGASKVCIIPHGCSYVIKVPFNGNHCSDSYDDYFYFCRANRDIRSNWDYCFSELFYYEMAKRRKIEKILCKTRFLGFATTDKYPIYIQEKAVTFFNSKGFYDGIESQKAHNYCSSNNFHCFNSIWIEDAINYYGEAKLNHALKFFKDFHIADLHDDNIGYVGARPVLIDFSNFND